MSIGKPGEPPLFSLVLPVASFSVDDVDMRAEEGVEFLSGVEQEAIAGTRKNLLSEALLDGANFPDIRLNSRMVAGQAPDYTVTDELRVIGHFIATHADLGLTRFSVMGGLLFVRDENPATVSGRGAPVGPSERARI